MNGPDIAVASDFHTWLVASVEAWIADGKKRSQRRFASEAGIPMGTLSHVLKGTRMLPVEHEPGVVRVFELDEAEASVLSGLASIARDGHDDERLLRLRGRQELLKARQIGTADADYVGDWTTVAIREMSAMVGFRPDAEWIQARLRPVTEISIVAKSLEVLKRVHARVADPSVELSTGMEPTMQPAKDLQQQVIEVAGRRVEEIAREDRFVQAYLAAVPETALPKLRRLMEELVEKVVAVCKNEAGEKTVLVQVSTQMVPLTDPDGGGD